MSAPILDGHRTSEIEVLAERTGPSAGFLQRAKAFSLHELGEILPPMIFFFIGFNLIVLTTNLLVADYFVTVGNFMLATVGALLIGKAVGVANAMPLMRRYDRAPLIQPILFKTLIYWAAVFVVRLLERLVEFWLIDHNPLSGFPAHLVSTLIGIVSPRSRFGSWSSF